jgi:hypothetical protein
MRILAVVLGLFVAIAPNARTAFIKGRVGATPASK